jgi:ATP-dependent RNA helicase DDX46/PRP5
VVDFFFASYAGLQDSDDEDLEHDIDQQIESMLAPKRIVKEIKAPIGMNPGAPGTYHY